jgi:hypothetical protein
MPMNDQPDSGPRVEPTMDEPQLARTVAHQDGGERGAGGGGRGRQALLGHGTGIAAFR